jgi:NAD(P)-dependent dehydrogenase (short-subunit alcohol dehydrogenase family)
MKLQKGQVAVVTGAASGIGFALAQKFAERGLSVVLSDVQDTALNEAVARLSSTGADVLAVRSDVGNVDEVNALRDRTLERFGRVDVICNNAGIANHAAAVWEYSHADWQRLLSVNLWGTINGIQAFVPLFVEQGSGYVVNTASMGGVATIPFNGTYNASKHAVVSITETMRGELDQIAPSIGVTVVCPGLVKTNIDKSVGKPADRTSTTPDRTVAQASREGTIEADDVASQVLEAIATNQLHLFTNPGSGARIHQRIYRLLSDLNE